MQATHILPHSVSHPSLNRCPIDHAAPSHQKTAQLQEIPDVAIECDAHGVWHIHSFDLVRSVLRSGNTRQAGFKAERLAQIPRLMRQPILYQDGKAHQEQRRQTARFFAPKTVSTNYRAMMEGLADRLVAQLQRAGKTDLSRLTLELAVRVAAEVVGLTNSLLPGMPTRLEEFFRYEVDNRSRWSPRTLWHFLNMQRSILAFFFLDVRPAIQARRRQPREDLISHLLAQGYTDMEILTECVTFAAAGMITTREFISVSAWHLLERPDLRARYLVAPEEERYAILGEILRLEPVVGHLYRRATTDLSLDYQGRSYIIPQGALIDLHIHSANADPKVIDGHPLQLCPGRELKESRVTPELMSFGDGHHRCPGSYVAIQETDILLHRLLALDGLRIERRPNLSWNKLVTGYELRKFLVTLN
jgi:cytochrome P450